MSDLITEYADFTNLPRHYLGRFFILKLKEVGQVLSRFFTYKEWSLFKLHTTVTQDSLAGDVVGLVASQELDNLGDIIGIGKLVEGD